MFAKPLRYPVIMLVIFFCLGSSGINQARGEINFTEDFEKGMEKWDLVNPTWIQIVESGDPQHGKVMSIHPGGPAVYALIKESAHWTNIKVEGDVFFPNSFNHYLGFIYNYNTRGFRADFGCIFFFQRRANYSSRWTKDGLKRPGSPDTESLLSVNPHRDSNASRLLYYEYQVLLGDARAARREWNHFKAEVVGPACHFYLEDMKTPKITDHLFEYSSGRIGFKPRYGGSPCWIDNITVTPIEELSYKGPILPAGINYKPGKLITAWQVIGPFVQRKEEIETDGYLPGKPYDMEGAKYKWEPFKTDPRGCVVSGRVCEAFSAKRYAYFHTEILAREKRTASLEFSTANHLILWINGSLAGEMKSQPRAWYDFWENPRHKGEAIKVALKPGRNHLIVLVRGGRYPGDGFFLYSPGEKSKKLIENHNGINKAAEKN